MGSLIQGIGTMIGSGAAARKADAASSNLNQRYQDISGYTMPYIQAGQNVLTPLTNLVTGSPTGGGPDYVSQAAGMVPGQMSQAQLEQTPGYQFVRDQGLKAVAGTNAARGLGVSGAALKGAAGYATGLANTTYKDQFNMAQTRYSDVLGLNTAQQANLTNQYNKLFGVAGMGAQSAANLGAVGAQLGGYQANALMSAGNDLAQGTKALASGIGNTVNEALGQPTGQYGTGPSLMQQGVNWLTGQGGTSGYDTTNPAQLSAYVPGRN